MRRHLTTKRAAPDGQHEDGERNLKEAKAEDDSALERLAGTVAEAVDYAGKALITVSDPMHVHEPEPEMVLETLTPTTQQ